MGLSKESSKYLNSDIYVDIAIVTFLITLLTKSLNPKPEIERW